MKDFTIEDVKVKINQLKEYVYKNSNGNVVRGELEDTPFDEIINAAIGLSYLNGYKAGIFEDDRADLRLQIHAQFEGK